MPRGAAVEAGVEAEHVDRVPHLVGATRDADDTRALLPGDLAHHRADRAGRGGDDHGLAVARLADVEQAHVCGEAGHAQAAERVRRLVEIAKGLQVAAVAEGVVLPAGVGEHELPLAEIGVARRGHAAHRAADHRCPDLDGGRVAGADLVHQVAHVRVE